MSLNDTKRIDQYGVWLKKSPLKNKMEDTEIKTEDVSKTIIPEDTVLENDVLENETFFDELSFDLDNIEESFTEEVVVEDTSIETDNTEESFDEEVLFEETPIEIDNIEESFTEEVLFEETPIEIDNIEESFDEDFSALLDQTKENFFEDEISSLIDEIPEEIPEEITSIERKSEIEQIEEKSIENELPKEESFDLSSFDDGEIDLSAFDDGEIDLSSFMDEESPSKTESISLDEFSDGDVDLSAFMDTGSSSSGEINIDDFLGGAESLDLGSFITQEKPKEEELFEEESLDIELVFDDAFANETVSNPSEDIEIFYSEDSEDSFDIDDFFEEKEEIKDLPKTPGKIKIYEETSEFDDILSSLGDASPTTVETEPKEEKTLRPTYNITVRADDDLEEDQVIKTVSTDNDKSDFDTETEDVPLFLGSETYNNRKELEKNASESYTSTHRVNKGDSMEFDELDDILANMEIIDGKDTVENNDGNKMLNEVDTEKIETTNNTEDQMDNDKEIFFEEEISIDEKSLDFVEKKANDDAFFEDLDDTIAVDIDLDENEIELTKVSENTIDLNDIEEDDSFELDETFEVDEDLSFDEPEASENTIDLSDIEEDESFELDETFEIDEDLSLDETEMSENAIDLSDIEEDSFEIDETFDLDITDDSDALDSIDDLQVNMQNDDDFDGFIDDSDNFEQFDIESDLDLSLSIDNSLLDEPVKKTMSEGDTDLLKQIASEISSLRNEINDLKKELASSGEKKQVEEQVVSNGFFSATEDDEVIALSGDELNNILINADFTQESPSLEDAEIQLEEDSEIQLEEDSEIQLEDDAEISLEDDTEIVLEDDSEIEEEFFEENLIEPSAEELEDNFEVSLEDDSEISLEDDSEIELEDDSEIALEDDAEISLEDDAEISLEDNSEIILEDDTEIILEDDSEIALEDDSEIALEDDSEIALDDDSEIEEEFFEENLIEPSAEELDISSIVSNNEEVITEIDQDPHSIIVPSAENDLLEVPFEKDEIETNDPEIENIEEFEDNFDLELNEELDNETEAQEDFEDDSYNEPTDEVFKSDQWDEEPLEDSNEKGFSVNTEQSSAKEFNIEDKQIKEDIKSVLLYMDQLLENLPEDKIEEFAKSDNFAVYKKLFTELGLV